MSQTYWINTVSKDHLERGIAGGFTQANHGKPHLLKRLKKGDFIAFYSPKTAFENGLPLQAFTALAEVIDDQPYQVVINLTFQPFRRNVTFVACEETPIQPLIEKLSFITDKKHWGYKFRFGLFEIPAEDFKVISQAMKMQE